METSQWPDHSVLRTPNDPSWRILVDHLIGERAMHHSDMRRDGAETCSDLYLSGEMHILIKSVTKLEVGVS